MRSKAAEKNDQQVEMLETVLQWFHARGWAPFEFQRKAWDAYLAGKSGLIHAPTGIGKTYAAWFGTLMEWMADAHQYSGERPEVCTPLRTLWITPLRALTTDTVAAILRVVEDFELPWSIECRTGDTPAVVRNRQKKHLPTILVTTPESLNLLLSYPGAREKFNSLRLVVVDEWHELMGSKRGVLVELALARLRSWNQRVRIWGLSATLGNTESALKVLLGDTAQRGGLIRGRQLEFRRLSRSLSRMVRANLHLIATEQISPLAFPIMVNRLRTRVSSEKLADRVRRMQFRLERQANNQ